TFTHLIVSSLNLRVTGYRLQNKSSVTASVLTKTSIAQDLRKEFVNFGNTEYLTQSIGQIYGSGQSKSAKLNQFVTIALKRAFTGHSANSYKTLSLSKGF